ncbi:MAG TPA: J domain-containing protein [Polyangiaceae bacterium]
MTSGASGARGDEGGARGPTATVFVSDPTAEAERVAQALRSAGYAVVDVPLSMLVARVAVQHPRVILVDADSEGALDAVARMRELPDADDIDVLFVARPGGAVASPEEAMGLEGSGLFVRPVDIPSLVRKVDVLTGGAAASEEPRRSSSPPPSVPSSSSKKRSSVPPSLPPASMRGASLAPVAAEARAAVPSSRALPPRTSRMPSEPPTSASGSSRRAPALAPPVSPELQQLLADAEQRAQGDVERDSMVPSPEDEIEAVLPAELLAALDEPLEEDEDDDEAIPAMRSSLSSAGVRERTSDGGGSRTTGASTTGGGSAAGYTPRGTGTRSQTGEAALTPPPPHTHGGTQSGPTGAGVSTTGGAEPRSRAEEPAPLGQLDMGELGGSIPPPTAWSSAERQPTGAEERDDLLPLPPVDEVSFPAVLGPGDALRVVARAIAARTTGSVCLAAADAERRIVLREGDVVTTSSTSEDESLLAFLGVRGDLPKETVRRLAPKFPPFGRHAGAALVARGYLRQDQMWPTLRAHAEWLLARTVQMPTGRVVFEPQPPGRLAGEPSVFGGSSGAEVFVEVVRRIVPPAEAIDRLGGPGSRVSDGPEARLLGECALGPAEVERLRAAAGHPLRDVLGAAPEGDLATVIFALAQLGVVEVLRAVGDDGAPEDLEGAADLAAIDAEAIRERVRARLQLVDDGDYFALLGVTHEATGYEVRRAFLELRRAFDPSRLLTPEVADLADDVRKITLVLEEAYDILKDAARRERYRRAIEAVP